MHRILYRIIFLLGFPFLSIAQKKQIDPDAFMKPNGNPGFLSPMPTFIRWVDDSHFILSKRPHPDSLISRNFLVDAKTGTETPAADEPNRRMGPAGKNLQVKNGDIFLREGAKESQLTATADKESNPVFSPDSNYVAFTRNNNLYTLRLSDKREQQLTTDGSDVILNGYASWVYMEEILGRATNYRAFWWSPDSRHLAFFRSDDTKVPEFIITDGNGQHGYVEKQRYPKAGDPNPELRVGIVSPDGGNNCGGLLQNESCQSLILQSAHPFLQNNIFSYRVINVLKKVKP